MLWITKRILLNANDLFFLYLRDAEIMQQKQKKASEKGDPKAK